MIGTKSLTINSLFFRLLIAATTITTCRGVGYKTNSSSLGVGKNKHQSTKQKLTTSLWFLPGKVPRADIGPRRNCTHFDYKTSIYQKFALCNILRDLPNTEHRVY